MSTSYSTRPGDTFESIAQKFYGSNEKASLLIKANPSALEPLTIGTQIIVPDDPDRPKIKASGTPSDNPNEVALIINGTRFRFWVEMRITRSMDSMDTIEILCPFESEAQGFRETFVPFSYADITVTVGGAALFTGVLLNVLPSLSAGRKELVVTGYSLPGVITDCSAPSSSFPLEVEANTLKGITDALIAPFGLKSQFTSDIGSAFPIETPEATEIIYDYLSKLARQRNLVISSTEEGALLFQQSTSTGQPVANLVQGQTPLIDVTPQFSPQDYYSHVTGIEPTRTGRVGAKYAATNSLLGGVLRPHTFNSPAVEGGDLQTSVEAKLARMFANAVAYTVNVATWRDPNGVLWAPNMTVTVTAPDAMIYSSYEFLIRSVTFSRTPDSEVATLSLVLPGAFSGELPESLPWAA